MLNARLRETDTDRLTAALFGRNLPTAPIIRCATTNEIFEKTALAPGAMAYRWTPTAFDDVGQLADHLKSGFPICTAVLKGRHRSAAKVEAIYLLGTDHDGLGVDQLLKNRFVAQHAAIVYETASSTPAAPRSRALYILDTAITPAQFRMFIRRLLALFGQDADERCSDPARIWYGSTNPRYLVREGVVLPVSVLAALPEPPAQPTPTGNSAAADLPPELVGSVEALEMAIRARLGVTSFNAAGWSNPIHCPFHDDQTPSAAWNERGYLHCFACQTSAPGWTTGYYGRKHVGAHFGLGVRPTTTSAAANTLPSAVFEQLNAQKLRNVARIWEALAAAGYQPGKPFQTPDAIRDLPGIGANTIRATLKAALKMKTDANGEILSEEVFIYPFLHSAAPMEEKDYYVVSGQIQVNNSRKRGRPTGTGNAYVMPSAEQLAVWLCVTDTTPGEAVDREAYTNGKAYRLAKHTSYMQRRDGKQAGMSLLGRRLGVSRRTVYAYNELAGIEARPVYTRTPITWDNISALPFADAQDVQTTKTGKRFVPSMFIEDVTGLAAPNGNIGAKHPPLAGIAADLLKRGRTIYLTHREFNAWYYQPKQDVSTPLLKMDRTPASGSERTYSHSNPFSRKGK